MIVMPLVLTPFLIPAAKAQLQAQGYAQASGAEQVVPGFGILFAFLAVQQVISMFFDEYAWGTWDRLRVSAASTADVLTGKTSVAYLIQLVQLLAVVGLGALFFGYRPTGSPLALILVISVFSVVLCAFGIMIVSLSPTRDLAMSLSNLLGMLMAGVGGALGSTDSFPDWAHTVAHASPAYWAMQAVERISLDGATVTTVLPQIGIMVSFAAAFALIGATRFHVDQEKGSDT